MRTKILSALKVSFLALVLSFGVSYVYAWNVPTATPPNANVSAPINTGSSYQIKTGWLKIIGGNSDGYSHIGLGNNWWMSENPNGWYALRQSGVGDRITVNTSGNVGIGTGTDSVTSKLEVVGNLKTSSLTVSSGASAGKVLTSDASGNATWQASSTGGGMIILVTDAQKIAYYSGHGATLPGNIDRACASWLVGYYGCVYNWTYDGAMESLEARSDGYIYLTHVPTTHSGECGYWLLCTTGYADYVVWNYLTNTPAGSADLLGCTVCSPDIAYSWSGGPSFRNSILGVTMTGINTTHGFYGWTY